MFTAVKFMVASVIVTLFGGFVLAGILTTPQAREVLPAAATQSPSPMTTEELLSDMVAEEVEPGVFRVTNDGMRDLRIPANDEDPLRGGNIVAGLDGSVWLFLPDRFFRLGDADQAAPGWRLFWPDTDIEISPDGHVWLIAQREDGSADLVSFRDRLLPTDDTSIWGDPAWPEYADRHYIEVEAQRDGTVWTAWFDTLPSGTPDRSRLTVGQFYGGWIPWPTLKVPMSDPDDWWLEVSDDPAGEGMWLAQQHGTVRRFAQSAWHVQDRPFDPEALDVGLDGTAWIQTEEMPDLVTEDVCGLRLARFDGTTWDVWEPEDGVPDYGSVYFFGACQEGVFAAATDGSVWLAPPDYLLGEECRGIADFDGTTWSHYLDGVCVFDASVAPDGAVWLLGGEMDDPVGGAWFGPLGLYVITPEAAADAE